MSAPPARSTGNEPARFVGALQDVAKRLIPCLDVERGPSCKARDSGSEGRRRSGPRARGAYDEGEPTELVFLDITRDHGGSRRDGRGGNVSPGGGGGLPPVNRVGGGVRTERRGATPFPSGSRQGGR